VRDARETVSSQFRALLALVGALLVLAAIGFFPRYLSHFPAFAGVGWQVHFHVATLLAWLGMLLGQAWLAATGRFELHRQLGRFSFALVPVILLGFAAITHYGQMRQKEPALLGATLIDGSLFLGLYGLAMLQRKNPSLHSRYMLLTPVSFLNPTLGRAVSPALSVPFELAVFVVLYVVARRRGTPARPYLVAALLYVGLTLVVVYVSLVDPRIIEALWALLWG
jgi:hypothetical protein